MSAQTQDLPLHIVTDFPPPPPPGTVTVTITGEVPHLGVQLSGEGTGWSASGSNLQLRPASAPANYRLIFQLSSSSASVFDLVGVQVYFQTTAANTQKAVIYTPASPSLGTVELRFLNGIEEGDSVQYQLFIGVSFHDQPLVVHWPDPTISFDPERG